jgi:HEAT repeat protein
MFLFLYLAVAFLSSEQARTPATPQTTLQEIRTRLEAQERRTPAGQPDAAIFGEIARLVFDRAAQSRNFPVWSEACASPFAVERQDCTSRLWSVLKNTGALVKDRATAGAALVSRKEPEATAALQSLVKGLETSQLAQIAHVLRALPDAQSVPLLARLLASPAPGEQVAACQVLGTISSVNVRPELQQAVAQAPPGTDVWNACMVARARLGEPDSVNTISGYSHHMSGDALLDAAEAMVAVGNEQGIDVLKKVGREASPMVQLAALEQLAVADSEYAARFAEPKLQDANPAVRAKALVVQRRLNRTPSASIRAMLLDKDELVQLRAAEVVLDWAARQKSPVG